MINNNDDDNDDDDYDNNNNDNNSNNNNNNNKQKINNSDKNSWLIIIIFLDCFVNSMSVLLFPKHLLYFIGWHFTTYRMQLLFWDYFLVPKSEQVFISFLIFACPTLDYFA